MKEKSKPISESAQRGTDSTNYMEYAEVMRMAATANRMACNIALNVPMSKVLPTKDAYKEFIGALDVIQKYFYQYFKEYTECANIAKASEKSKETAVSVGS